MLARKTLFSVTYKMLIVSGLSLGICAIGLVGGCTSLFKQTYGTWIGGSIDKFIEANGQPMSVTELQDGQDHIYEYLIDKRSCHLMLYVNAGRIITGMKSTGSCYSTFP